MRMHLILLFLLIPALSFAQETVSTPALTIDRIFNSTEFYPEHFGPFKWLSGGEYLTTVEYNDEGFNELAIYHTPTFERNVLLSGKKLVDPQSADPIGIYDYHWSTDESSLLIFTNTKRVWRTNTRGDYYVWNRTSGELHQLGVGLPAMSLMFAKFNPQGTKVAYVSNHNIYVEDLGSREIVKLTSDGSEDIINGTFDWAYEEEFFCKDGFRWSPDGRHIAYWQINASDIRDFLMINNTNDIYPELVPVQYPKVGQTPSSAKIGVVDVERPGTQWLTLPGDPYQHYLPRMQWLGSKNRLLITQLNRKQNHLKLFVHDQAVDQTKMIYEEKSNSWIDIVQIDLSIVWEVEDYYTTQNGGKLVWMSEKGDYRQVYLIDTYSGESRLMSGQYDIASIKGLDENDEHLYALASPHNPTQRYLYSINLKTGDEIQISPSDSEGINLYDISPSGKFAVHRHQSANEVERCHLIEIPSHQNITTLYDNATLSGVLTTVDMPVAEFIEVTTKDGVHMNGKVIKPNDFDDSKKYPVLFYVYGEPAGQTATDRMDRLWHFMLAQQGYIVITLDNRGTPSLKGKQWRKSIYRKLGVINARDQAMAAKEILTWDYVDPERIAVWGWSGGGAMTLNLLFKYPEIYKTGIAVAAVTNQLLYDNIYQERYMGLPQENLEDFEVGSPIAHVEGLEGNLLYIHGTADDNVHYQNAEYLINALIKANKVFDLMIYPNRSHGIYEGENTIRHLYNTMTHYLHEHVQPGGK